jgi:hypothetical protein
MLELVKGERNNGFAAFLVFDLQDMHHISFKILFAQILN